MPAGAGSEVRAAARLCSRPKLVQAFNRVCGIPIEVDLGPKRKIVRRIHECFAVAGLARLSGGRLADLAAKARPAALRSARPPDPKDSAVEVFALVFEAARRALELTPHDVQLIAGLAMAECKIAELPTGEGKTLAAVFPACLFALAGGGVHILTFNDYLARRDAAWMGPVYRLLGLSVGVIQEGMSRPEKRAAYACDVTYATAKEAGFDFLRDQLGFEKEEQTHRPLGLALVDEADSILIDEARIPLVISGAVGELNAHAGRLAPLIRSLRPGADYEVDDEKRNVVPTEAGLDHLERRLGCGDLYARGNEDLLAAIHCALHAEVLLDRDVDYIVRDGKIEIVDEFTGRVMDKRHWPDGLQAAVEAKESLARKPEGRILGSITLQHFLRLYPALCGMTATAAPSAAEFKQFYGLSVVVIPPHRPAARVDRPDVVFARREAKLRALMREILEVHAIGRPVLVGTLSVRESEELAAALKKTGVGCEVLNARNDELEAGIIADAGKAGALTISTNMAGRGADIKLGGADEAERKIVLALGGLYVIGTNRHESLRIDRQLRGRAGRQGDPGSSRFFVSLEDEIFERYGLTNRFIKRYRLEPGPDAVDNPAIREDIAHAQRVIEGQNFGLRKSLWTYAHLMEMQRLIVQEARGSILSSAGGTAWLKPPAPEVLSAGQVRFGPEEWQKILRRVSLYHLDRCWADHLAGLSDLRESIHLVSLGGREPVNEFQKSATDAFEEMEAKIERAVSGTLDDLIKTEGPVDLDARGLRGPSSTWTYLITEDEFGWGVELLKGKHIGFAVGAAAYWGPLFILTLLVRRLRGRKKTR
ncbi:MAG: accessory Sec system translocase SecA2 [Candidatus Aminicenantes bacterium RBG_16_63_16]|nr:MAG: accessory Sec system translocase SecA2 [Candidatus Aminicenantes bacterium RBG_16_63_16]